MRAPGERGLPLVGVATGVPDGGVAIVRVSGAGAWALVAPLLDVREAPSSRRLVRRALRLRTGVEDALVVWMPGPRSFTGEDVVELHVHAGGANVREVVGALLRQGGEPAGPGAFTRRAYANGRLSLSEAEGIATLVAARTEAALGQARRLVAGELGRAVGQVSEAVALLRVEVEANLDFPEDVETRDRQRWQSSAADLREEVLAWLAGFERGRRAREQARVVLCGPPNAGKSSLFNALIGQARSIVDADAGTTRDYVEAQLDLGGHEVMLVDTAGLRAASGVESQGVARSEAQVSGADVVVWVESAVEVEVAERGVVDDARGRGIHVIEVENKRDLARRREWLGVSAASGEGLKALVDALRAWQSGAGEGATPWIGLERHRARAVEAEAALGAAAAELAADRVELAAFQLDVAHRRLAEIDGRDALGPVGDAVLDAIFSTFCIGK